MEPKKRIAVYKNDWIRLKELSARYEKTIADIITMALDCLEARKDG